MRLVVEFDRVGLGERIGGLGGLVRGLHNTAQPDWTRGLEEIGFRLGQIKLVEVGRQPIDGNRLIQNRERPRDRGRELSDGPLEADVAVWIVPIDGGLSLAG